MECYNRYNNLPISRICLLHDDGITLEELQTRKRYFGFKVMGAGCSIAVHKGGTAITCTTLSYHTRRTYHSTLESKISNSRKALSYFYFSI